MLSCSPCIVRFCAEEVNRQDDQPIAVWWMLQAWDMAMMVSREVQSATVALSPNLIGDLGRMVQPINDTQTGFRHLHVRVGPRMCPDWRDVPKLVDDLVCRIRGERLKAIDGGARSLPLSPADAYYEFELIHPFRDGNGRVGKILFNWLNGTLETPEMPPKFFDCMNY